MCDLEGSIPSHQKALLLCGAEPSAKALFHNTATRKERKPLFCCFSLGETKDGI